MTGTVAVPLADAADDGGQHVGQLGADDQQPLGVGLGRRDLQQRDELAGAGQAVLHEAVVGDLQQFLDPDSGGSQDLDAWPRPRTRGLPPSPGPAVCRRPGRRPRSCRRARGDRAGEGLSGDGEAIPRAGLRGRPAGARRRVLRCSSTVRTRTGRTGSRWRVRASMRDLRCRAALRWLISSSPMGQGATHGRPAGGVLERPLGQVQVERPNRCQALAVADPFHGDGRLVAGERW